MSSASRDPPLLLSRDDVAALLGVTPKQLTWWVWALRAHRRYDYFEITRRAGGAPRQIKAPIKPIKDMQRTLAKVLADCYDAPAHVHGFLTGRSPISNAAHHRRQKWVLRVDLADFFPSINFGRVRGMFMAYPFGYPSEVATILAQVCCHDNELPQGAPTSPVVSNFICRRLDTEFAHLARAERCHYTRYADDLSFSTDRTAFPVSLGRSAGGMTAVGPAIEEIIASNGFEINEEKTRLTRYTQRQRVTGLVVNEKVNVSRDYIRRLRNLLYIWRRFGPDDAAAALARAEPRLNWPPDKPPAEFRSVVRGRVQFVGSVKGWSHPVYMGLATSLAEVDSSFRPRTPPPLAGPASVRIHTEGTSDAYHLIAASAYFRARGEFPDLRLDISESYALDGDSKLHKHCEGLALTRQSAPRVCLFDRDNAKILSQAVGSGDWKNYGNGVIALALGAPPWRNSDEPFCIEMLYPDDVLQRENADGRRVFLLEEFDPRTGLHVEDPFTSPNIQNRTLVREAVYEISDGRSVGLAKNAFGEAVRDSAEPYSDIDFEGFRPTFELIREAVREAAADLAGPG